MVELSFFVVFALSQSSVIIRLINCGSYCVFGSFYLAGPFSYASARAVGVLESYPRLGKVLHRFAESCGNDLGLSRWWYCSSDLFAPGSPSWMERLIKEHQLWGERRGKLVSVLLRNLTAVLCMNSALSKTGIYYYRIMVVLSRVPLLWHDIIILRAY